MSNIYRPDRTETLNEQVCLLEAENAALQAQIDVLETRLCICEKEPPCPTCDLCALQVVVDDSCRDVKELQNILQNEIGNDHTCRKFAKQPNGPDMYRGLQCLLGYVIIDKEWCTATAAAQISECKSIACQEHKLELIECFTTLAEDECIDLACRKKIARVLNAC